MRYVLLLFLLLGGCVGPDHSVQNLLTPDEFHLFYTDGDGSSSGTMSGMNDPWRWQTGGDSDYTAWTVGLTWNLSAPSGGRELREAARAMQVSARLMAEAAIASLSAPEPIVIVEAPTVAPEPRVQEEPIRIVVEAATPVAVAPVVIEVGERAPAVSGPVELRLPASLEAALLALASRVASAPVAALEGSQEPVVVIQPGATPDIIITVGNSGTVEGNEVGAPASGSPGGADSDEPQGVMLLGISSKVWTQLLVALGLLATAFATYLGREKIPGVKRLTKKGRAEKKDR